MVNVRALAESSVARIGGNETMVDYLVQMARIESGNNPNARNPDSSAGGLFQQIDRNWNAYGRGGNRFNPQHSTDAALRFALDNRNVIKNITGREPTEGEYYLAHFAGPAGVSRVLRADPDTPLSSIKGGQSIINSNPRIQVNGKRAAQFTVGDLREWADEKMGADIAGAADYNQRRAAGETTVEQDNEEAARRRRQLIDLGYDETSASNMGADALLGAIFLKIIENIFDASKEVPAGMGIEENRASPPPATVERTSTPLPVANASPADDLPSPPRLVAAAPTRTLIAVG